MDRQRRNPDSLLGRTQLPPALELLGRPEAAGRLTSDEQRFIEASTTAQMRSERRRSRVVRSFGALAIAFGCAALVAGFFALRSERATGRAEASEAEALSRQIALQATVLRASDTSLSSQLALIAYRASPTSEALAAVLDADALPASPRLLGSPGSTAVATTSDGRYIAYSDSVEAKIRVVDLAGGLDDDHRVLALGDPDQTVYAMGFSPASGHLASAGDDARVTLWNLETGRPTYVADHPDAGLDGRIEALAFTDDGSRLYAGANGRGIAVWRADGAGQLVPDGYLPAEGQVMSLTLERSGRFLAAAMRNGDVVLWDTSKPEVPLWTAQPLDDTIASTVALSPDGDWLVAGYRNSTLRLWSIDQGGQGFETTDAFDRFASWVTWVQFSPDGKTLAGASSDGTARLWEVGSWARKGPEMRHPTVATALRFLGNDEIAVAVADGSVRRWSLRHPSFDMLAASVWSTTFDRTGRLLLAASGLDAAVWDYDGVAPKARRPVAVDPDSSGLTGASALSPDGRDAALGTRSGPVYVVPIDDSESGSAQLLPGLTNLVESVAYSSSGGLIVGGDDDGRLQLWSRTGEGIWSARGQIELPGLVMNVAFGHQDKWVLAASDEGAAYVIDIADLDDPRVASMVPTGESITFGLGQHPGSLMMATGNADGTVRLWTTNSRTRPCNLLS